VRCWDEALVRKVFDVEASRLADQDPELFARVHHPIRRMMVEGGFAIPEARAFAGTLSTGAQARFIGEDALLETIVENLHTPGNIIIGIRGAPGSGKSHLVKWMEHRLKADPRFTSVPVPRDINSLGAVLRRIAQAAGIGRTFEETRFDDIDREILADTLVQTIQMDTVGKRADLRGRREWERLFYQHRDRLRQSVAEKANAYLDARASRHYGDKSIPTPDFTDAELEGLFDSLMPEGEEAARNAFVDELRAALKRAWLAFLGLSDFDLQPFLAEAQEKARASGRRLLLLMEDITSFDALHRDLFNFLFAPAGSTIAVLGWTTAYQKDHLKANHLERMALRVALTDEPVSGELSESGERTFAFQDDDDVLGLVSKYLAVIRKVPCTECGSQASCWGLFGEGLYPFNRHSLLRFHENMVDDNRTRRQTPRIYLDNIVRQLLLAAADPHGFPRPDRNSYLTGLETPPPLEPFEREHPEYMEARKWYSEDGRGTVELPDELYDWLGVKVPPASERKDLKIAAGRKLEIGADTDQDTKLREFEERAKQRIRDLDAWARGERPLGEVDYWRRLIATGLNGIGLSLPLKLGGLSVGSYGETAVFIEESGAEERSGATIRIEKGWRHHRRLLRHLLNPIHEPNGGLQFAEQAACLKELFDSSSAVIRRKSAQAADFVLGFVYECLVLDAACRALPANSSLLGSLHAIGETSSGDGQPRSDGTHELKRLLEEHRETLTTAFRDLAYESKVLDLTRLSRAWRGTVPKLRSEGQPPFSPRISSTKAGNLGAVLNALWPAVVRFRSAGLADDEQAIRELAGSYGSRSEFGVDVKLAMEDLRLEYARAYGQPPMLHLFREYIEEINRLSGLPLLDSADGQKILDNAVKQLDTDDVYTKLSAVCSVPYNTLIYGAKLEQVARKVVRQVRAEMASRQTGKGGPYGDTRSVMDAELRRCLQVINDSGLIEKRGPPRSPGAGQATDAAARPEHSGGKRRAKHEDNELLREIHEAIELINQSQREARDLETAVEVNRRLEALRGPRSRCAQWLPLLGPLNAGVEVQQLLGLAADQAQQALEARWGMPVTNALDELRSTVEAALGVFAELSRSSLLRWGSSFERSRGLALHLGDTEMQQEHAQAEESLTRTYAQLPDVDAATLDNVHRRASSVVQGASELEAGLPPEIRDLYRLIAREGRVTLAGVSGEVLRELIAHPLARALVISFGGENED
jgi:hypothetical protein